jgi:hypothetical protein
MNDFRIDLRSELECVDSEESDLSKSADDPCCCFGIADPEVVVLPRLALACGRETAPDIELGMWRREDSN